MTYEEYLDRIVSKQRAAIHAARERCQNALDLFRVYQGEMAALGLKPMTFFELDDWRHDLEAQERELDETGGDTEVNRLRYDSEVSPPYMHPLPDGATCADCAGFAMCVGVRFAEGTETTCWSPTRFRRVEVKAR